MMKIKFRGKRLDDGEQAYGHYLYDDENNKGFIAEYFEDKSAYFREVIPETVGQYTDLKDKNGKEICEGDILHRDGYWDIYIVWDDKHARFGWLCTDWVVTQGKITMVSIEMLQEYEIVGNIHENHELLEQR